jgi:hypothetical protein
MPMDNPMGYMKKGNPGGAVMVAAKGRMADLLKKMMAAKLKARLGKAMGEESEEEGEEMESEPESKENELPEDEMRQLLEMYSKLK